MNNIAGIQLSLDTPLNNTKNLNTLRPAVLRQYFGDDVDVIFKSQKIVQHHPQSIALRQQDEEYSGFLYYSVVCLVTIVCPRLNLSA